jgi:hypothetical protein
MGIEVEVEVQMKLLVVVVRVRVLEREERGRLVVVWIDFSHTSMALIATIIIAMDTPPAAAVMVIAVSHQHYRCPT